MPRPRIQIISLCEINLGGRPGIKIGEGLE